MRAPEESQGRKGVRRGCPAGAPLYRRSSLALSRTRPTCLVIARDAKRPAAARARDGLDAPSRVIEPLSLAQRQSGLLGGRQRPGSELFPGIHTMFLR